ncbi:MAG: hypothetical protein PWQ55_2131 [Chloroflexota bacterium]|nr:hypothetical protein [Chloroflexota bacterium]
MIDQRHLSRSIGRDRRFLVKVIIIVFDFWGVKERFGSISIKERYTTGMMHPGQIRMILRKRKRIFQLNHHIISEKKFKRSRRANEEIIEFVDGEIG